MSLAACIIRCPCTTRSPGCSIAALREVVLEHRRGRLLDLQEQRVLLVAALEQHDERPGADAADTDDLAGDVDDLEPLQQMAPVVLQRRAVGAELVVDRVLDLRRRTCRTLSARSRNGTTIGGWLTIRYWPSTSSASFDSACRLSRVCAFAAIFSRTLPARLRRLLVAGALRAARRSPDRAHQLCFGHRAYQMSIVASAANSAIASR